MNHNIRRLEGQAHDIKTQIERLQNRLAVTEDALRKAHERPRLPVPDYQSMTPAALAECIADEARGHGSDCAFQGEAYTSASWKEFRKLLHMLTTRLVEAEAKLQEYQRGDR